MEKFFVCKWKKKPFKKKNLMKKELYLIIIPNIIIGISCFKTNHKE
jgi:hypothetical protein